MFVDMFTAASRVSDVPWAEVLEGDGAFAGWQKEGGDLVFDHDDALRPYIFLPPFPIVGNARMEGPVKMLLPTTIETGACFVIDGQRTFGLNPRDVRWVLDGHVLPAPEEKVDLGPMASTVLLDHQLYAAVIARLRTAVRSHPWIRQISLIGLRTDDGSFALALGTRVFAARHLEEAISVMREAASLDQPTPYPVHDFYIAGNTPFQLARLDEPAAVVAEQDHATASI
jgi:hypothetical protein